MNIKENTTRLIIKSELLWWAITAILLVAILFPINAYSENYPFWIANSVFILAFITFTRYIFLLNQTPLRYVQWLKVVIIILCIPLVTYMIRELHAFQLFADERGVQSIFTRLAENTQTRLVEFTKTEMLFFGVGGILSAVVFPFRMLISFWRTYNKGTT